MKEEAYGYILRYSLLQVLRCQNCKHLIVSDSLKFCNVSGFKNVSGRSTSWKKSLQCLK